MSRDLYKGNIEKKCPYCSSDENGFTLLRKKLIQVKDGSVDNRNRVVVKGSIIQYENISGLSVLYEKLRKNIFTTFDTNEYGTETEKMIQVWRRRIQNVNVKEPNEGLLEVLHFLGDKEGYNKLLLSLPLVLDELLVEFHLKTNDISVKNDNTEYFLKRVKQGLLNGRNRYGHHSLTWFTDDSQEEAIDRIKYTITSESNHFNRSNTIRSSEIDELANSIYETLSNLGVKKFGDWEENYSNNSPIAVSIPKLLAGQFSMNGIFEGIEYCNYCGAEHSRSLMYSGKFYPFTDSTEKSPETQDYFGSIQNFEYELLPQIQELWREQIKEFKRRDKKASKMWDGAQDRLQKKKQAEEEAKRQAEIALLEEKLNALKKKNS